MTATLTALCGALVLAGCGRDDDDGSTAAADTDAPVTLMTIASVGSPIQNYPDIPAGAEAAAKAINDAGGIDGRQVEIEVCNTQSDTNKAVSCARKAAQEDVVAVVGQLDLFTSQTLPVLEAGGIPSVGINTPGNVVDVQSPVAYPLHAGAFSNYIAIPAGLVADGAKRIAVLTADVPPALFSADLIKAETTKAGAEFAGMVKIPPTGVTDYSPYAQRLKELRPDAVALVTTPAQTQGMFKANAGIGLDITYAHNAFSFGESEAETVGEEAEGILLASPFPSYRDANDPAVKEFNEQMKAAGTDKPIELRPAGFNSWLSVHAIADVAKTIDGPLTAESLTAALDETNDLNLKDVLTWSPGTPGPKDYERVSNWRTYFSTIEDGKLAPSTLEPVEVTPAASSR